MKAKDIKDKLNDITENSDVEKFRKVSIKGKELAKLLMQHPDAMVLMSESYSIDKADSFLVADSATVNSGIENTIVIMPRKGRLIP